MLDAIDDNDAHALRRVVNYFFGLRESTAWPARAHEKAFLTEWMLKRGEVLGSRWEGWWGRAVNADTGVIDWVNHGVFKFIWDDGALTQLQRVDVVVAVEDVNITPEWLLLHNYSDELAEVQKGRLRPRLCEFFVKLQTRGASTSAPRR